MKRDRSEYHKAYRERNKEKIRAYNAPRARRWALKYRFGLTPIDVEYMVLLQDGCAICGAAETGDKKYWRIDHDHKTGKVRGLLCNRCNLMLGQAKDNIQTLANAIVYLEQHKQK